MSGLEPGRRWAQAYLYLLLLAAAAAVGLAAADLQLNLGSASFVTLCLLAAATELYPLVVRGAASSLIAPALFVAFVIFGWPGAVLAAAIGAILGQIALRRAPSIIAFNVAQYILSAAIGARLVDLTQGNPLSVTAVALFLASYYFTSNFLSHGFLLMRGDALGQPHLRALAAVELPSFLLSLTAGLALIALHAGGDRIDPLGLAFFFLPFIGLGYVMRQAQDARLYQQQTLSLVNALTTWSANAPEEPLRAMAAEIRRDGAADAVALLRLSATPHILASSPVGLDGDEQRAAAVARLARWRGGTVQIRRTRRGARLQSWYGATAPGGEVAVVIARRRPYAYFGQMRRLVRTAAGVMTAVLDREQLLNRRQEALVTAERARLAQRIHDTLAQDLVALGVEIGTAERVAGPDSALREVLQHAKAEVQQALARVREAIVTLEPEGSPADLVSALRVIEAEYRARGLELSLTIEGDLPEMPPEAAQALLRGAAEGVRNAFKHTDGSAALRIVVVDREIVLRVLDSGQGSHDDEPRGTGLGLRLLGQEVRRCGGCLELRRLPEGSEFEVRLPLSEGVSA